MAKALRIFLNTDMRCAHEGLSKLAADNKIKVETLEPGEYLIFINTAKNRIKLYACNNIVAYYRSKNGQIDLKTIAKIPQAFKGSGKIDYDASLREVIEEHLTRKGKS